MEYPQNINVTLNLVVNKIEQGELITGQAHYSHLLLETYTKCQHIGLPYLRGIFSNLSLVHMVFQHCLAMFSGSHHWFHLLSWQQQMFTTSHRKQYNFKKFVREACVRCHGTKCPLLTAFLFYLSLFSFTYFSPKRGYRRVMKF